MNHQQLVSAIHSHPNNSKSYFIEHDLSELNAMSLKELQAIWSEWSKS